MSETRMNVFLGIMCSVWMAFPLTATAFDLDQFVGVSDRGSTKVKTCFADVENRKGGRTSFSNKAAATSPPGVNLIIRRAKQRGADFSGVLSSDSEW
jgi:hypothetical protein